MGWETQTEVRTLGRVGARGCWTPNHRHTPLTASGPGGPQECWHVLQPCSRHAHLLGDLGHIQLIPELSGQPRKALGAGCSLPTADGVPVALQRWLLPLGHSEDTAQFPGAWCTRELLQEGRGKQQLLGADAGEWLGGPPTRRRPEPHLSYPLCQV